MKQISKAEFWVSKSLKQSLQALIQRFQNLISLVALQNPENMRSWCVEEDGHDLRCTVYEDDDEQGKERN